MSFSGNLEDLSITDVLQLLHATRKSGTLCIESKHGQSKIVLRDGFIVSACHPKPTVNIGSVLLEKSLLKNSQLNEALSKQKNDGQSAKPLIGILVEMGFLQREQAYAGLQSLIEGTVSELVGWDKGVFSLDVSATAAADDYRFMPAEIEDGVGVDTQAVLMNALRIFDERKVGRSAERVVPIDEIPTETGEAAPSFEHDSCAPEDERSLGPPKGGLTAADLGLEDLDDLPPEIPDLSHYAKPENPRAGISFQFDAENMDDVVGRLEGESNSTSDEMERVVVVFSKSGFLKHSVRTLAQVDRVNAMTFSLERDIFERINQWMREGIVPVLVVDTMHEDAATVEDRLFSLVIDRVRNFLPEIPIVQLSPDVASPLCAERYQQGVRAIIPRPYETATREDYVVAMKQTLVLLRAAWLGIFSERKRLAAHASLAHGELNRLKQRVELLRNPREYPDVSLLLLQIVAENLERAMIFLVRPEDVLSIGAFGVNAEVQENAGAIGKRIPLVEGSHLKRVIENGDVFFGPADGILEQTVFANIGTPFSHDVLLLPLKTKDTTVALIYADFGSRPASRVHVDTMDVLAHFGGLLLEISLLRRQLEGGSANPPVATKPSLRIVESGNV